MGSSITAITETITALLGVFRMSDKKNLYINKNMLFQRNDNEINYKKI